MDNMLYDSGKDIVNIVVGELRTELKNQSSYPRIYKLQPEEEEFKFQPLTKIFKVYIYLSDLCIDCPSHYEYASDISNDH
jgi:hypothetical protein